MLSLNDDYLIYTVSSKNKEHKETKNAVALIYLLNCRGTVVCASGSVQTISGTCLAEK